MLMVFSPTFVADAKTIFGFNFGAPLKYFEEKLLSRLQPCIFCLQEIHMCCRKYVNIEIGLLRAPLHKRICHYKNEFGLLYESSYHMGFDGGCAVYLV